MTRFIPVFLTLFTCFATARAEPPSFETWEQACARAESVVHEGDLVFLDIPNFIFRNVARGSDSWTSHVGIVFRRPNGEWVVAESTIPRSKETPLCQYLKKSSAYKFEIKRLTDGLTQEQVERLRAEAQQLLHRFYGLGFDYDSKRLFCSKFAYLVYRSIDVEIGEIQSLRQVWEKNNAASLGFWRAWFLGNIPWERRTITPASQLNDPKLTTVLKGA